MQVNDKLQVVGHSNVYAIGDATDVKETKVRDHVALLRGLFNFGLPPDSTLTLAFRIAFFLNRGIIAQICVGMPCCTYQHTELHRNNVLYRPSATCFVFHDQLGYLAGEHGKLAAKNIQAALQGKPLKSWKPYAGMPVRN